VSTVSQLPFAEPTRPPEPRRRPAPSIVIAGLTWLLVLLVFAGRPAVRRTQEARVLEAAREMLGAGWRQWLIPRLNGQVRLQKPPLAYWLSAASFKVFGVSEWAGRLPTILAGWLTLCVTYATAAWLFGRRTGFLAAASLAGTLLFCRHMQLAETDGLTALFVTAAVAALWRGAAGALADPGTSSRREQVIYYNLAAVSIALAALAKGPPAAFPIIFFIALAATERRWQILWKSLASGAAITLAVVALPWFLYVRLAPESRVVAKEIHDLLGGEDHPGWFFVYFPMLIQGLAPWTLVAGLGLADAARRWKADARARGLLLWCGAVFVPLCIAGNKQPHYLLPLLSPVAILAGWVLHRALGHFGSEPELERRAMVCFAATVAASAVGAAAIVILARVTLHRVRALDVALALVTLLSCAGAYALYRSVSRSAGLLAYAACAALLVPVVAGYWAASLPASDSRTIAASLRSQFAAGPYCFFGDGAYLPLCFAMRSEIPYVKTPAELESRAAAEPDLVVLIQADPKARSGKPLPPLPPAFRKVASVGADEERLDVYRRIPASDSKAIQG
jgi:4-amino-4-deoxy-L-arabinose transferase-like glycosyltransferase